MSDLPQGWAVVEDDAEAAPPDLPAGWAVVPESPGVLARAANAVKEFMTKPADPMQSLQGQGLPSAGADSFGQPDDSTPSPRLQEAALRLGIPLAAGALAPVTGGASIPLGVAALGGLTGEILAQQSEMQRGAREQAGYGRMAMAPVVAALPLGPASATSVRAFDSAGNLLAVAPQAVLKRALFGGTINAGASVAEQAIDSNSPAPGWKVVGSGIDWGEVASSAAFGAIFGGALGGLETVQRTRAGKEEILQLRKATGHWQDSDMDFLKWVKTEARASTGPNAPAEEGAPVPEGQNPGLPEGYTEVAPAPADDISTPVSSEVERQSHKLEAADSISAPAPIPQPPTENADQIPSPGAPIRDDAGLAPAAEEVAGGSPAENLVAPEARAIETGTPAQENAALNPAPVAPNFSEASAEEIDKWATAVRDQDRNIDMQVFGPERGAEYRKLQRMANGMDTSRADVASAKIAEMEATLTPEQQNVLFGINLPNDYIDPETAKSLRNAAVDIDAAQNIGELAKSTSQLMQGVLRKAAKREQVVGREAELYARTMRRIKELGGDVKQYVRSVFAHRSKIEGDDVFELAGVTQDQLANFLQGGAHGAQLPSGISVKQLPAAPAQATVTPTPAGPVVAPKPAEDKRVSQLVDSKQFKVQREFLLDAVRKAKVVAPETGPGELTIDVPGDGTFKVRNTQSTLQAFGDIIAKRFGKSFSLPSEGGRGKDARKTVYSPFSSPLEGSRSAGNAAAVSPVVAKPTTQDLMDAAKLGASTDPTRAGLHHVMADSGFAIGTDGRVLFAVAGGGGKTRAEIEKLNLRWPDWRNVVPKWVKANDGLVSIAKGAPVPIAVNTREAIKLIDQAKLVTSEKAFSIRLHKLPDGRLGVSAFSPDFGDYMSDGVSDKHKPFVAANPIYLREALIAARMAGHEHVQLFPSKDGGPLVVKGGDNFMALVMPVKTEPTALKDASVWSPTAPAAPKPSGIAYQPGYGPNAKPAPVAVTPPAAAAPAPLPATPADIPDWASKPIAAQTVAQPNLMETPASRAPLLARTRQKIANLEKLRAEVDETNLFPSSMVQHMERVATDVAERLERVEKRKDELERKELTGKPDLTKAEETELNDLRDKYDALYESNEKAEGDLKAVTEDQGETGLELIDSWLKEWQRRLGVVEAARLKAAQSGTLNQTGAGFTPRSGGRDPASPSRGTSGIGMPPPPPGTATGVHGGSMMVTMPRTTAGTISQAKVMEALENIMRVVGSQAPIRHGRIAQRSALGIFKSWTDVIRLRQEGDIPTAAHEVAHAVSKRIFGSVRSAALIKTIPFKPIVKELQALGKALYGSSKPAAGYTAEGFSELVRLWLTTEDAAKRAPAATAWLENNILANQPPLRAAMHAARDAIDIWRGQGAAERMNQQTAKEPGKISRAITLTKAALSKRSLIEEFTPLDELAEGYEQATGKPLPAGQNPGLIAQAYRRTAGAVLKQWVEDGVTDIAGNKVGPSLREAYARLKLVDEAPFHSYLFAKQALIRLDQGKNAGIERADAEWIIKTLETPAYIDAAAKIADFWQAVRDYKREAYPEMNGPMMDAIEKANPVYYGPLAAALDPNKVRAAKATTLGGGLYRFKGHGGPTKRMYEQSLLVAQNIIGSAQKDLVLRSVVQLRKVENLGWLAEEVPVTKVMEQVNFEKLRTQIEAWGLDTSAIPPDTLLEFATQLDAPAGSDPIIAVREADGTINPDGTPHMKRIWLQVPREVQEIVQGVHAPERLGPIFELLIGGPTRMFKLGTTGLRAGFSLITNPERDFDTFMMQSIAENPALKVAALMDAYRQLMLSALGGNPGPYLQMFHQMGISAATFVGGDIAQAKREARGLFHGKFFKLWSSPVESLRDLMSFTESAPRLAELMLASKHFGWKPGVPLTPDQAVQIRLAAARVTTDFRAHGSMPPMLQRGLLGPFANAGAQGARGFGRTWKENQGNFRRNAPILKGILNALTLVTLPLLWNWYNNRDKEWYRMLPWRERYLYINIEHGENVIQIPLPQEWGIAFGVLPIAAIDSLWKKDPRSVEEALKHAFAVLNPVDWPVPMQALKEQWQNKVDFFNRPIIPRSEIDLIPGAQRGPYTSWLGKTLGDAFPNQVSPRRVDAAIREVFGGAGADYSRSPELMMKVLGLKVDPRASELADLPVIGRQFRRGGTYSEANQALSDFWDDQGRYGAWLASARNEVKQGQAPLLPMSLQEQGYAGALNTAAPYFALTMRIANATPDLAARQKLYRSLGELADKLTALRPPTTAGMRRK